MKKGTEFKLQWPSTPSVLSIKTTGLIEEVLKENPLVTVSEKLDGSNICISSGGWIASRRVILVEDFKSGEIDKVRFNRASLQCFKSIGPKVITIHNTLASSLGIANFQTLIYGEYLQDGTATTQEDLFSYKERHFKPNHFYAFGLAIYFDQKLNEEQKTEIRENFEEKLQWELLTSQEPNQFMITLFGKKLQTFLQSNGLETVPLLTVCSLDSALTNKTLINDLLEQRVEGFILTSKDRIFKWKFVESGNRHSQIEAIKVLKTDVTDPSLAEVVGALEKVGLNCSKRTEQRQPTKRPGGKLYSRLFKSAETKFPKLEDQYDNASSEQERNAVRTEFKLQLQKEIEADLVELGYSLKESHQEEIGKFLEAILVTRTENWTKKFEAKSERS